MRKRKDTRSSKCMASDARDCWIRKVKQCMDQLNEEMFSVTRLHVLGFFLSLLPGRIHPCWRKGSYLAHLDLDPKAEKRS